METKESAPAAGPEWVAGVPAGESLAAGAVLGSYRVVELIGAGGMGHVYVAEHVKLGRRVALKVLREQFNSNAHAIARFFAEARAVNKICHENIVEISDFFENDDGKNYYVMELLKGEDLGRFLTRMRFVPVLRAVDIAAQIATGLTAVHAAQIIHRDLKPDNIFLVNHPSRPGFVKLLDFGVAKLCDPDDNGIQVGTTAAGQIVGTPEYMSPEQASGDAVDHRTDIYALGIVLYEMVTGVVPFRGRSFGELVVKHLTEDPKRPSEHADAPSEIPPALDDLIMELLAKDASDRPQTMSDVEQRLRAIQDRLVPSAPRAPTLPAVLPESSAVQVAIGAPRSRSWWLLALPAVVAGWIAMRDGNPRSEAAEATVTEPVASEVVIKFRSTPSGAVVRAAGSELVLGTTPFAREFPRGKPVEVQYDLPGHSSITQYLALVADAEVTATLPPVPPSPPAAETAARAAPPAAPAKPRARPRKKLDRDGVLSVF